MSGPRPWLSWLAFAALVAVAVGTAGWGNDTSVRRHRLAPAPPPPWVSVPTAMNLAAHVDLVRRDLPAGYREVTASPSNGLGPGDRLRLCGAAVPGAAGRIAGHHRDFVRPDGRRARTQVAVYADDGASRALDALRARAPRCSVPVPPGHVEQPSALALHVRLLGEDPGSPRREVLVLRSGDLLTVLELDGSTAGRTITLARVLAARLP